MSAETLYLSLALIVVGVILLIMEFVHPGTFLVLPGTIILFAGVMLLLFGSFDFLSSLGGPIIVVGVLILAGVFAILFYSRVAPTHPPVASNFETLQNYTGEVTTEVQPGTMKGKVRVRGEVWSARADEAIPVGTKVKILGGEGVTIRVAPLSKEPETASLPEPSTPAPSN